MPWVSPKIRHRWIFPCSRGRGRGCWSLDGNKWVGGLVGGWRVSGLASIRGSENETGHFFLGGTEYYIYYIILYYIILYYIILYYIILYYIIFYFIILYYFTILVLYYMILYFVILFYTILYYIILYYIILNYTILYYIILCYIILYYIILYHVILYYMIFYYIILYYIILYYIILYYIIFILYLYIYIHIPWAPIFPWRIKVLDGFGHLKSRLFTINNPKNVGFGGAQWCVYRESPNDLYVWRSTPQNKAFQAKQGSFRF